jgi:hypothetical protein
LNGYELIGIWPGLAPELDAQEEEAEAEAAARGEELKKVRMRTDETKSVTYGSAFFFSRSSFNN